MTNIFSKKSIKLKERKRELEEVKGEKLKRKTWIFYIKIKFDLPAIRYPAKLLSGYSAKSVSGTTLDSQINKLVNVGVLT